MMLLLWLSLQKIMLERSLIENGRDHLAFDRCAQRAGGGCIQQGAVGVEALGTGVTNVLKYLHIYNTDKNTINI